MALPKKLTKKKIMAAMENTGGVLLTISKRLDVSYPWLYEYVHRPANQDIMDALAREKEKIIDLAETKLFKQINQEKDWAIKFLLSTKGKDRGYVERQEVDQQTTLQGAGFQLNVIMPEGVDKKLEETKKSKKQ